MHEWLLEWLSARSTTRLLGSLIVLPLLGSAWLFWRVARRRAPFRSLWRIAAWCVVAFCSVPLSVVWTAPAWQNVARIVFAVVVAFGWWRLYRAVPALLRFPTPHEAGAVCEVLLHSVDEIVDGRRARGVLESEESVAAITRTRMLLRGLALQMKEAG